MKRLVSDRAIQLAWFTAGVFATGAVWFFLSKNDLVSVGVSVVGAISFVVVAMYLHGLNDQSKQLRLKREQLGSFLKEAEALLARANEDPGPIQAHNEWVAQVERYLTETLDSSYAARFGNFDGMTFYLSNPNSGLKRSLQGRSRRIYEFIAEIGGR